MPLELMEHQKEVLPHLSSGKILYGGVGSGKSVTVLAWYMKELGPEAVPIYIITTAKKRNSLEWEKEGAMLGIGQTEDTTVAGVMTIDSWNNIKKYEDVEDAFFVFDEQKVIGTGSWVKSFIKIARKNTWILCSATPGDTWLDYAPVFIANNYYKNISEFRQKHVLYEPFSRYPKIKTYLNETKLQLLRNEVLVEMPYYHENKREVNWIEVGHDKKLFDTVYKERWNPFEDKPVKDASELFRLMRRVVNENDQRLDMVRWVMKMHPKIIIFYNFNYELDMLRGLASDGIEVAELNGHKKDEVPLSGSWLYLVQYVAGAEAWNCIETDAMILFSLTYSYKNFVQSMGRIDRINTPFERLYYYIFVSNSVIDHGVRQTLKGKKNFNERRFLLEMDKIEDDRLELCEKEEI